nr:DUF6625 family protein [Bifidobacterium callitrichos]
MTLSDFKRRAEQKLGFKICLSNPYKLCDYKPSYGFLFEDLIKGYKYWGHCDCDLIFGNLDKILTPILDLNYDKIFAAGHLTLYKNTRENNRRFMNELDGRVVYREAFTTDKIYVFDENVTCSMNPYRLNVHHIFQNNHANIFEQDLSFNVSTKYERLIREYYDPQLQRFIDEKGRISRIFFSQRGIKRFTWDKYNSCIHTDDYIYIHLQSRKMRFKADLGDAEFIEIKPDRFVPIKHLPYSKKELHLWTVYLPSLYWFDVYYKKVLRKIKLIKKGDK